MTIGEKIKKLRDEKGMTQKDLCSDCITRNMLSQIEHNSAQPSISTIRHIASVLEIDAGYFLSDSDDPSVFRKLYIIDNVKSLFNGGESQKCLEYATPEHLGDPELVMYFYCASLRLGNKAFTSGDFELAYRMFSTCLTFADALPTELPFSEIAAYYSEICKKAIAGKPSDNSAPSGDGMLATIFESANYDMVLKMIKSGKSDLAAQLFDQLKLSNPIFRKHINARLSMASSNYFRARDLLAEITEQFQTDNVNISMQYVIYSDLEKCCKAVTDYEGAYYSSISKNEIAKKFNVKAFEES